MKKAVLTTILSGAILASNIGNSKEANAYTPIATNTPTGINLYMENDSGFILENF